jgi:hypothetical protein
LIGQHNSIQAIYSPGSGAMLHALFEGCAWWCGVQGGKNCAALVSSGYRNGGDRFDGGWQAGLRSARARLCRVSRKVVSTPPRGPKIAAASIVAKTAQMRGRSAARPSELISDKAFRLLSKPQCLVPHHFMGDRTRQLKLAAGK